MLALSVLGLSTRYVEAVARALLSEFLDLFFPTTSFFQSFSSVVGPNGSGKSNVIDAMLFVFGKRAKQLRLNKVSELIHNSTHHRDLEMAKVSVFFQEINDLVSVTKCCSES